MKQKNKYAEWFQPKGYLHFSPKLKCSDYNFIKRYIEYKNQDDIHINISKHSFYPLIHRTVLQRRYKKIQDPEGNQLLTSTNKHKRSHFDFIKEKSNAKPREIFFANHLDTQIYSYFAKEILGRLYEDLLKKPENIEISECISAYRFMPIFEGGKKGKSSIHFAKEIFHFIGQQQECCVLAFDIEKFFDTLNHNYLKSVWCKLLKVDRLPKDHFNIYNSITNFSFVNENDLLDEIELGQINDKSLLKKIINNKGIKSYCRDASEFKNKIIGINNKKGKSLVIPYPSKTIETQKHFWDKDGKRQGIAQGTAISAFLANLYLLEFDNIIFAEVCKFSGLYRRYCDDIIIVCPIEMKVKLEDLVLNEIKKYGLKIQPAKTEISIFRKNKKGVLQIDKTHDQNSSLKYLGFEFDGINIRIKKSSIAKYYRRLKRVIRVKSIKKAILEKKTQKAQMLHKNKIYKRYSHFGHQNFITYAYRASSLMHSKSIKSQTRRHIQIIKKQIEKYELRAKTRKNVKK